MVPTPRGGYRSSLSGAQPPPVATVEVLVDDELGRLLLQPFLSSVIGRGEGAQDPTPYPVYDATRTGQRTHREVRGHLPYGAYSDTSLANFREFHTSTLFGE
jgi:hypothetical protein